MQRICQAAKRNNQFLKAWKVWAQPFFKLNLISKPKTDTGILAENKQSLQTAV